MFESIKKSIVSSIAAGLRTSLDSEINIIADKRVEEKLASYNIISDVISRVGGDNLAKYEIVNGLNAQKNDVWAFKAATTIAQNITQLPFVIERMNRKGKEISWTPITDGELPRLIANPNKIEPASLFWTKVVLSYLSGRAYVRLDRGGSKSVKEMVCLDPTTVMVETVEEKGAVSGVNETKIVAYTVGGGGKEYRVLPSDMIVFIYPSATSTSGVAGPASPALKFIMWNESYARLVSNFFRRGALHTGTLETDMPLSEPQIAAASAKWDSLYNTGADSVGGTAILAGGLKYHQISPPLAELLITQAYTMPREAILGAFGLPPVLAGVFEYANYANAQVQLRLYWEYTIQPITTMLASTVNQKLTSDYGTGLRLRIDLSGVSAMQEDEVARSTRLSNYVRNGIITPNEARAELGKEAIEGGDELKPVASGAFPGASLFETPSSETQRLMLLDAPDKFKSFLLARHAASVKSALPEMERVLYNYLMDQSERVIARLKGKTASDGSINAAVLLGWSMSDGTSESSSIFVLDAENKELYEATDELAKQIVKAAGTNGIKSVKAGISFDITNPNVVKQIAAFHNRSSLINDTTYEEVRKIIADAYTKEGISVDEIARSIRQYYDENAAMRADRTARTEVGGMLNGGAVEGYRQGGIERKEWLTAIATSPRHELIPGLNGQIVDIDQPFDVDGELLMYPGDQAGSPGNTINCLCTVAPVVEQGEE